MESALFRRPNPKKTYSFKWYNNEIQPVLEIKASYTERQNSQKELLCKQKKATKQTHKTTSFYIFNSKECIDPICDF